MLRVGFVDDESTNYMDYAKRLERRDIGLLFYEGKNVSADIIDWILSENLMCLFVDYDLRKKFSQKGTDLVFEINQVLPDFPCIMLTNYPEQSKDEELVPYRLIWDREKMNNPDLTEVVEQINSEVQVYLKRKATLYEQYGELMKKRGTDVLTTDEEERFFRLHALFSRYGETDDVPAQLLVSDTNKKLDSLIERLSLLVKKEDR